MTIHEQLLARTDFLRRFYTSADRAFAETKRLIEGSLPPFEPYYSEDGEPPYLAEWLEAEESEQVLGGLCVSMLAGVLQKLLDEWEEDLGIRTRKGRCPTELHHKSSREKRKSLKDRISALETYTGKSPLSSQDETLLEEIVLARNMVQHPEHLSFATPYFSNHELRKVGIPHFTSEFTRKAAQLETGEGSFVFPATLHVSEQKLEEAIVAVEKLSQWLHNTLWYRHRPSGCA